jgi:hypothetical protein
MVSLRLVLRTFAACAGFFLLNTAGCKSNLGPDTSASKSTSLASAAAVPQQQTLENDVPSPEKTSGFDGKRAFAQVAKQVSFGPRPSGSQVIMQTQNYILSELSSYGCAVETDSFTAETPAGPVPMKNILVKVPGDKPGIIMLGTHYDTKKMDNFVGADDGGSSSGVMLELARVLCSEKHQHPVWIAFFDGEEAVQEWTDTDSRYGSRQMSAKLAMSGDAAKIKAFMLADIVGTRTPRFKRETNSTNWLTDLVWTTAAKLGYSNIFVNDSAAIEDDHLSFLRRRVPCVDVIDLEIPYWHTPQDTLDKISAKSLAIVGHVFVESIKQLEAK